MKKYKELRFVDDFMFCKVMSANPNLCRRILSLILRREVQEVVIHGTQKPVEITAEARGIRMDVYLDDEEGTVYDLEMQTAGKAHLPKRLRYYQSMLDLNHLERGTDYGELPHTVIIFICTFDYFKEQLPVYTFENRCAELPELRLEDAAEKIFVNPDSRREGIDVDFHAFLDYLKGKKQMENSLVAEIEEAVKKARENKEWEVEYMSLQAFEMDIRREGRAEGRAEGIIKSGRRHAFSDEVILEDIMAETGYDYAEAKKALENYDMCK